MMAGYAILHAYCTLLPWTLVVLQPGIDDSLLPLGAALASNSWILEVQLIFKPFAHQVLLYATTAVLGRIMVGS